MTEINQTGNYSSIRLALGKLLAKSSFTSYDSQFARSLSNQKLWTYKQAFAAHKMLGRYVDQLKQIGLLYDILTVPEQEERPSIETIKRTFLKGQRIIIEFSVQKEEFQSLLDHVKGLPGRAWDADSRTWNVPLNLYSIQKLEQWGFIIDEKILQWKKDQSKQIEIEFPKGLHLYPFQQDGLKDLVRLNGRVLLADEMGLGKTIQAIAYLKYSNVRPCIIVVPASLKLNWQREIQKWLPNEFVYVLSGSKPIDLIDKNIIIINYDILKYHAKYINEIVKPQCVIFDECHMVKNQKAQRTKALREICKNIKHVIAISGTPIVNRPSEFYTTLSLLNSEMFNNWYRYGQEFCNPKYNGFGWDYSGASNAEKLNDILKNSFMVRRLKKDVMKDLPNKIYSIIPFDITNENKYRKAEEDIISWLRDMGQKEKADKAERAEVLVKINYLKQLSVEGKLEEAIEWIQNFIEQEKLVVFCTHHDTIDRLMQTFPEIAVKIDGRDSIDQRQIAVDQFQNNEDIKLFVGNIRAAGVGITLTAAHAVAFMELGWTPSEHSQAEDRIHRIGQEAESVNIYYLVGQNTIEEEIIALIDNKRKIIDAIMDGKVEEEEGFVSQLLKKLKEK